MSQYSDDAFHHYKFVAPIVLTGLSVLLGACSNNGVPGHYRIDVINQPVSTGAHAPITVQLIEARTGRPVDGATLSNVRLTMPMARSAVPSGKGVWPDRSHSEQVRFVGSPGGGQYSFVGDISMPGTWILVLSANVPGEAEPMQGSTKFAAGRERHDP